MKLTAEDKKWRARNDLDTLLQAEKIKADKLRMSAAKKEAKLLAKEKIKEASAVQKLAAGKSKLNKPTKKGKK